MAEGKEENVCGSNIGLNVGTGCGSGSDSFFIRTNNQDYHNMFPDVVLIADDSRALQMLTTEDVLAMRFDSYEAGESFYRKYALAVGFIVEKDFTGKNKKEEVITKRWVCNRACSQQKKYLKKVNYRLDPGPSTTRVHCHASFWLSLDPVNHKCIVKEFVAEHTHELAPRCKSHLQIDLPLAKLENVKEEGLINVEAQPIQVVDYLVKQEVDCDQDGIGRQDMQTSGDAYCGNEITISELEAALFYLSAKKDSDPGLFYETEVVEGRLMYLFLADSTSQLDYACFGDVMAVYRTNSYKMHFVILAGLNHHHQTCVFGCALLHDETFEAYSWLFQTFLHVMHGCMPISVVTDGHKALYKAIKHVMPRSRHRMCTWHLLNDARFIVNKPSFISDFKVCMLKVLSQDDFELKWKAMVDKYKLSENPWIHWIYKKRHMWAETYLRGHFWAGLQSTRLCVGINEHLSRFSQNELKLHQFIDQFDMAVNRVRWNEAKAQHESTHVPFGLTTPLMKIEKHAAEVFTTESFKRFLSELRLETHFFMLNKNEGSNHRTYKLSNYEQHLAYEVMFKASGPSIKCSCLKFETLGFPCCHAIHVIIYEGLEKIPQNLIHPRWTKSAKSTAQFWQRAVPPISSDIMTRLMRYGTLMSAGSMICYLGSKSDQAFDYVSMDLLKSKHEIQERYFARNATNSGTLGMGRDLDTNPLESR